MATNKVHAGQRLKLTAAALHRAGDLVYEQGHYGVVQDNVAVGEVFTLHLGEVWLLPRVPSTLANGARVAAPATSMATTLPIGAASATLGNVATTGWNPIGRTIATGTATTAKIMLFNPNQSF